MGIFTGTEKLLDSLKLYPLGSAVREWNKFFTYTEDKNEQLKWIKEYNQEAYIKFSIYQREIYLKDDIERLHEIAAAVKLSEGEAEELRQLEEELAEIPQRLWMHKQARTRLLEQKPKGAYVRGYCTSLKTGSWWEVQRKSCKSRGGCCERDCGCCKKKRLTLSGKEGTEPDNRSHCTPECACCIRYRGFYKPNPKIM